MREWLWAGSGYHPVAYVSVTSLCQNCFELAQDVCFFFFFYNGLVAYSFRSKRISPPLRGFSYKTFSLWRLAILQILYESILLIWSFQYRLSNTHADTGCMSHCSNVLASDLSLNVCPAILLKVFISVFT